MVRSITLLVAVALAPARAQAETVACAPGVALDGDPSLIDAIDDLLLARGIAVAENGCPAARVQIDRRAELVVVSVAGPAGIVERAVSEIATAATVIESFVRDDLHAPLLATRTLPERPDEVEAAAPPPPPRHRSTRGIQLFSAIETSFGSDRTRWGGAQLGACVTLGRVCAAARLRFAAVISGPGVFHEEVERRSTELLLGLDVPLSLGHATLSPGVAFGLGAMFTHADSTQMIAETGGLRGDVHATLTMPIGRRLALDLTAAVDLTQETRVEWHDMEDAIPDMPRVEYPDEPWALLRFGVGIRYGGL